MNDTTQMRSEAWIEHARRLMQKVPNARSYAFDYGDWRAIAACLASSWRAFNETAHTSYDDHRPETAAPYSEIGRAHV